MKPKPAAAPVVTAVRTVSETDEVRLLEGLAYPFRGRDTYGTFFSARTDYAWDLFPDVLPATAARAAGLPLFIRPVTYHHGFDSEIGLRRHGGWSPVRMDGDGIWVQAQLDKRAAYYDRLAPLLDANALGLSGGSAEHSVRIDQSSGEVLAWPAYELALTPTESNPLAQLATRSGDGLAALRIVSALAGQGLEARLGEADVSRDTAARAIQTFSDIVAGAELNEELPEAFDTLTSAIYSAIYATDRDWNPLPLDDKRSAIQTSLDQFRDYVLGLIDSTTADTSARAFLSAIRSGRRHSASDQEHIDAIHQHATALGPSSDTSSSSTDGSADEPAAARTGEVPPAALRLVERIDPAALRAELLESAASIGRDAAARLLGR